MTEYLRLLRLACRNNKPRSCGCVALCLAVSGYYRRVSRALRTLDQEFRDLAPTVAHPNLAGLSVKRGDRVQARQPLGRTSAGEVTVELRKDGRPFPITLLL